MTKKKRKHYPEDFKKRGVSMVLEGSMSLTEVAKQLDVPQPILSQWKLKFESDASLFEAEARLSALEEVKILREELKKKTMENAILKKATAFFASQN